MKARVTIIQNAAHKTNILQQGKQAGTSETGTTQMIQGLGKKVLPPKGPNGATL